MHFFYDSNSLLKILDGETHRTEIREKINLSYEEFIKTPFCENSSDMFGKSEMMIVYDKNDFLLEVEIYNPEAKFFYFGRQLLGIQLKEVKDILNELSINHHLNEDSLTFQNSNIRLFLPNIDEEVENAIVESVVLFK